MSPRPLTLKDTRRILDDWGGLVRGESLRPGRLAERLMHGFPRANLLARVARYGPAPITTGPGPRPGLTPVESAVEHVRGWQRWVLRVDALVDELPVVPWLCLHAHYVGQQDAEATARGLGTSRRTVFEQRQKAEAGLCERLNRLTPLQGRGGVGPDG